MTSENFLHNVGITLIGSVGGTGIIIWLIKYYANIIAKNLLAEYDAELKKELALFNHNLDTQKYITQKQYDLELEIYRKLSGNLYAVIVKLLTITTNNLKKDLPEKSILEFEKNNFTDTVAKIENFQNNLHENAAFIPEDIFKKYDDIYINVNKLFWKYKTQLKKYIDGEIKNNEIFSNEDYHLAQELQIKNKDLSNDLREYLQSLKIIN